MAFRGPDMIRWVCLDCGSRTFVNKRRGTVVDHKRRRTGGREVCSASGQKVLHGERSDPVVAVESMRPTRPVVVYGRNYHDTMRESVHACRGGLPDTDRRRH